MGGRGRFHAKGNQGKKDCSDRKDQVAFKARGDRRDGGRLQEGKGQSGGEKAMTQVHMSTL